MRSGRLDYDRENVYWKPTTRSHMKSFPRKVMEEGKQDLPWESEAYKESDKVKK
jgi:hypothetical protein